jgi:hypothetical protein
LQAHTRFDPDTILRRHVYVVHGLHDLRQHFWTDDASLGDCIVLLVQCKTLPFRDRIRGEDAGTLRLVIYRVAQAELDEVADLLLASAFCGLRVEVPSVRPCVHDREGDVLDEEDSLGSTEVLQTVEHKLVAVQRIRGDLAGSVLARSLFLVVEKLRDRVSDGEPARYTDSLLVVGQPCRKFTSGQTQVLAKHEPSVNGLFKQLRLRRGTFPAALRCAPTHGRGLQSTVGVQPFARRPRRTALKPYRAVTPLEILVGAPASFCVAFVEFDLNIGNLPFCLPEPRERATTEFSVHPAYNVINGLYIVDYTNIFVVARDGFEPPTPAFSELWSPEPKYLQSLPLSALSPSFRPAELDP